jgi:hypothetical protein
VKRIRRGIKNFGAFMLDFVVGEDWRIAVGIVAAMGLTALLAHHHVAAWWILPVGVLLMLGLSLREAIRKQN